MYEPKGRTIAYLRAAYRRIWRWSKERTEALHNAKIARNVYICGICNKQFASKEVTVHHVKPVVDPKKGFQDFCVYFERMFVPAEKLQVVCKPCHKIETAKERKLRRKK